MVKIKKHKNKARVKFHIHPQADEVILKGSWNGWKEKNMKRKKDGSFYIIKFLPLNETYEFGYLADGKWINDESCEMVDSPFGSKNSVLEL